MAPSLSTPLGATPARRKDLEVVVRNTFLHVEVPEAFDSEVDLEQQPAVKRALTTPVAWLSDESDESTEGTDEENERGETGSDEEDENSVGSLQPCLLRIATHDPFEAGIMCKQPSLRRVTTFDDFECPASLAQTRSVRIESQVDVEVSAACKRPSGRRLKTYDAFESPALLSGEKAYFFDGTASASAARAEIDAAVVAPQLPSGWAEHISQMAAGTGVEHLPVRQESVATQPKCAGAARGKAQVHKALLSRTTIMLRNLPNNYTRDMLVDLIDWSGFACKFDFLYFPIDFRTHAALGYAFVNLVSPEDAEAVRGFFDGFSSWSLPTSKVCSATWSNPLQGYEAHAQRYRNSPLMHEAVPDAYRPILLADGMRTPFPPPTKKIKPPRQGTERMLV